MMSMLEDPAVYAGMIAPIIDRTAISVSHAVDKASLVALRGTHRFHPAALVLLAGNIAAGSVAGDEFRQLTRYEHFGPAEPFLVGLAERGAITLSSDGTFEPTADGLEMAKAIVELQVATLVQLYAPRQSSLPALRSLMDRAAAAAAEDSSSPLARFSSRAWLPASALDGAHIWKHSVTLRLHRSDTHATAWTEAGYSAQEIRQLPPGPERSAIEVRTNELAAIPWTVLDGTERLTLLAGLGALPGTGSPI